MYKFIKGEQKLCRFLSELKKNPINLQKIPSFTSSDSRKKAHYKGSKN
jgi:hypothetical protein